MKSLTIFISDSLGDLGNYEMSRNSREDADRNEARRSAAARESWTSVLDPEGEGSRVLDDPQFTQWLASTFQSQNDTTNSPGKEDGTRVAASVSAELTMPVPNVSTKPEAIQAAPNQDAYNRHRSQETHEVVADPIITPQRFDVLMGRGRPFQEHSGNRYMQELIKQAFSEYESARKHRKTYLADNIVSKISSLGGRFLKKNDQGDWEQVPISMAREKVSHAFRKKRELDGKKQRSAPGKGNK